MILTEYVEKTKKKKKELDAFEAYYKTEHLKNPESWPIEMGEEAWGEQELCYRF